MKTPGPKQSGCANSPLPCKTFSRSRKNGTLFAMNSLVCAPSTARAILESASWHAHFLNESNVAKWARPQTKNRLVRFARQRQSELSREKTRKVPRKPASEIPSEKHEVSGHDFSRAERGQAKRGFNPWQALTADRLEPNQEADFRIPFYPIATLKTNTHRDRNQLRGAQTIGLSDRGRVKKHIASFGKYFGMVFAIVAVQAGVAAQSVINPEAGVTAPLIGSNGSDVDLHVVSINIAAFECAKVRRFMGETETADQIDAVRPLRSEVDYGSTGNRIDMCIASGGSGGAFSRDERTGQLVVHK